MATPLIPKANAPFSTQGAPPTREWWQYLDLVGRNAADVSGLETRVSALETEFSELPSYSFTVTGLQSVSVIGQPSQGNVTLALQGDSPAPGANKYYATDASGNKGWYSFTGLTFPQAMSIASLRP